MIMNRFNQHVGTRRIPVPQSFIGCKNIAIMAFLLSLILSCANSNNISDAVDPIEYAGFESIEWDETGTYTNLNELHEGILCNHERQIAYKKEGRVVVKVALTEPVTIVNSETPQSWGHFQFPEILKTDDGALLVRWSTQDDDGTSYGELDTEPNTKISTDGGKTWDFTDKDYNLAERGETRLDLKDGSRLWTSTPEAFDIREFPNMPMPAGTHESSTYYKMAELPEPIQGAYLTYWTETDGEKFFHAKINDTEVLRSSFNNMMNVLWVGDFKELKDGSILAAIFPANRLDNSGNVALSGISFYRSTNKGQNWGLSGYIPYPSDHALTEDAGNVFTGLSEPVMEVWDDGTIYCVVRTEYTTPSPMYRCTSKDNGMTWSDYEPFTINGVFPRLLKLKNGVLVLASGRPGLQLRLSLDGKGKEWTDPIELLPFMDAYNQSPSTDVTCGYAGLLEAGQNAFYIVYSDFVEEPVSNRFIKEIKFRKVIVDKM